MKATKKEKLAIALIALVLYVGIYVILSLNGQYIFTQSGQVRYANWGLSVTDLVQWQPRYAYCQRFRKMDGWWTLRANFWGYVFAPCILLDQTYVHPTVRLFDPDTGKALDTMFRKPGEVH